MSSKIKIELNFSSTEINYLHKLLENNHCDDCMNPQLKDKNKCGKCPVYRTYCTVKQKVQDGYEQKERNENE